MRDPSYKDWSRGRCTSPDGATDRRSISAADSSYLIIHLRSLVLQSRLSHLPSMETKAVRTGDVSGDGLSGPVSLRGFGRLGDLKEAMLDDWRLSSSSDDSKRQDFVNGSTRKRRG